MESRPRVLVLTTSYPSRESPAGIFVREHARAVAPYADVRIVHLDRGGGVLPHATPIAGEEPRAWRSPFPEPAPLWPLGVLAAGAVGLRAVGADGWRPDILHAHFFLAGFAAVVLARRRHMPVVVTEHWTAFLPEDPAELSRPLAALARFTFSRAQLVLPVSAELERELRALGVETPMRVIPNAVDVNLFRPQPKRPGPAPPARLLLVGLLHTQKGVDLLLRALPLVHADIQLDLVGNGDERPDLERLATELGVADRVIFHGLRSKAEIAELMRAADLYVSASRFENNPVAVIEALASGLPVVGTNVGAVARMIGEDGVVVPPGDPRALAAGIERAIGASYNRAAIAKRAASQFGAANVGRLLADAYIETARQRR